MRLKTGILQNGYIKPKLGSLKQLIKDTPLAQINQGK